VSRGVSGLAVELAIKDRPLADRIAAVLQDLNIVLVEPGSDPVSIVLTDTLPETGTDQPTILLADGIEVSAALRAGVTGVLPKSAGTTDLRIALEAAGQGLAIAPLSMLEDAHRECDDFEPFAPATSIAFTPREMEVLALLAEGASNKAIARKLDISVHTAKFHVASILEKLDATGRTDAVAHAVRLGLLML
jgi:DNA-binding NarL/FixJ family response regulator